MYRIGELAKNYGLKTDTLRFYDKHGLLKPSSRSEAGYRMYTEGDAECLGFILRAKAIGFSLTDIGELLSIELDKSSWACSDVKEVVDLKLNDIEAKIKELTHFQVSLKKLSDACCGGQFSAENCSILDALESSSETIECQPETDHCHPSTPIDTHQCKE
ncbi:Zn(2+)-responsive transcriptional regulator [Psychromonas sp. PT13]|uniref:Zn(2+)-responsive transcriptional regulator n=1 Tax=Psychromonas sp. PT13 TaxID=3439547 RepID=UPI003EB8CB71